MQSKPDLEFDTSAAINPLRAVSVGSLIKRIVEAHPDLHINDIIRLIRDSSEIRAGIQVVDERRALEAARSLLVDSQVPTAKPVR